MHGRKLTVLSLHAATNATTDILLPPLATAAKTGILLSILGYN